MLAFIDCETTGLEPERGDLLLEVGILLTDDDLEVIDRISVVIAQPAELLELRLQANPLVREMHTTSGLFAEIADLGEPASQNSAIIGARLHLTDWLAEHGYTEPQSLGPMAGSSVGFDRRFLLQWMRALEAVWHYRVDDVSSTREQAHRWRPDLTAGEPVPLKLHRVDPDLDDTLALARYYRTELFVHPSEHFGRQISRAFAGLRLQARPAADQ